MRGIRQVSRLARWLGRPPAWAILFSLALHLALIMLIQPAPPSHPTEGVLQARLVVAKAAVARPAPRQADTTHPARRQVDVIHPARRQPVKTGPTQSRSAAALRPSDTPPTPQPVKQAVTSPTPETDANAEKPEQDEATLAPELREQVAVGSGQALALPEIPAMPDARWYTARQVDRRPELMTPTLPVYPEQARSRGIEGSVVVEVHIDETGRVHDIQILEANPPGVFDAAVLEAYGQARYRPALLDGRPVRYIGKYRVLFKLN